MSKKCVRACVYVCVLSVAILAQVRHSEASWLLCRGWPCRGPAKSSNYSHFCEASDRQGAGGDAAETIAGELQAAETAREQAATVDVARQTAAEPATRCRLVRQSTSSEYLTIL